MLRLEQQLSWATKCLLLKTAETDKLADTLEVFTITPKFEIQPGFLELVLPVIERGMNDNLYKYFVLSLDEMKIYFSSYEGFAAVS